VDASFRLRVQQLYDLRVVLEISFLPLLVLEKLSYLSGTGEYIRRTQGRLNSCWFLSNFLHIAQNGINNHTEYLRYCCEPSAITPSATTLLPTCSLWTGPAPFCVRRHRYWLMSPGMAQRQEAAVGTSHEALRASESVWIIWRKRNPLSLLENETPFLGP
jgi:hypothetical protein